MSFSLSGIINTVAGAASSLAPLAMPFFPQAQIAMAGISLLNQATGGGVNQAVDILGKEAGLPKFLQSAIRDIVKDVLGKLNPPGNDDCCNAVRDRCGNDFRDIGDSVGRSIADIVKKLRCGGEEEGGADSWLVAIAKAMGKVSGGHAKKLAELSNKLEGLDGKNPENAKLSQEITNQMQGESQMLNLLQTAFSNVLKSIGEATANMARKG
ncbi:MAG TPA: hypothetical protein VI032_02025 [Burkholderiaceae bacterium]